MRQASVSVRALRSVSKQLDLERMCITQARGRRHGRTQKCQQVHIQIRLVLGNFGEKNAELIILEKKMYQ